MGNSLSDEALTQFALRIRELFGEDQEIIIMRTLFEQMGGLRVTIPTIEVLRVEERDRRIRLRFNGANSMELAEIWGVSAKTIRRIIKRG